MLRKLALLILVAAMLPGCASLQAAFKPVGQSFDRAIVFGRVSQEQADCMNPLAWESRNPLLGDVPENARVLDPAIQAFLHDIAPAVLNVYFYGTVSAEQAACLNSREWEKMNSAKGPVLQGAAVSDPALSEWLREATGRD